MASIFQFAARLSRIVFLDVALKAKFWIQAEVVAFEIHQKTSFKTRVHNVTRFYHIVKWIKNKSEDYLLSLRLNLSQFNFFQ